MAVALLDGQHLIVAVPGQNPRLTLAPWQVCVVVSMQMPGSFRRHCPWVVLVTIAASAGDVASAAVAVEPPADFAGVDVTAVAWPGGGQHLIVAEPGQNPVFTAEPWHTVSAVSMHTPACPYRHAPRPVAAAVGAIVDVCVNWPAAGVREGVALATASLDGQHLIAVVPGQNPLFTSLPHAYLPVSMHVPACPYKQLPSKLLFCVDSAARAVAYLWAGGVGGLGGGVFEDPFVVVLALRRPLGQHLILLAPRQNPVFVATFRQSATLVSMQTPACPYRHASFAGGLGGGVREDAFVVVLASRRPLGQHLILLAPRQNPVFVATFRQSNTLVSMQTPACPYRHASLAGGLGGGVFEDAFVVVLAAWRPLGQHRMLLAPLQNPAFVGVLRQSATLMSMQIPACPYRHASFAGGLGGGVCEDAFVVVLASRRPLGQHLILLAPRQNPVFVATFRQSATLVSMQTPACPYRHASFAGGLGGGVREDAFVVVLASRRPLGQHLILLAPLQNPVFVATSRQSNTLVSMQTPACPCMHASLPGGIGGVGADGGVAAFGPFVPVGQHLMWVAPVQNPVFTCAPLQSNLFVSMHLPGLL